MNDPETFFLDGQAVPFRRGETILQAARRAGHTIPSLCYDPRLQPYGACRVCVVKVGGRVGASCTTAAGPGLQVTVDDEVRELRRDLVELTASLLPDGPCPECRVAGCGAGEVAGRCELHQVAATVGARRDGRFAGAPGGRLHADPNPFLGRDYSRCINCYRCVRICDEIEGDDALTATGRGFAATIATWFDRGLADSSCELCGQCIHTCPTGALTDRKMATRIVEVEAKTHLPILAGEIERRESVCPYCGTGCKITLHGARGELLGTGPVMNAPASDGALCVKGQYGGDFLRAPDRLQHPLIRDGEGFREASWNEALDLIAARLATLRDTVGGGAFAAWASARTTNESNYLLMKLTRGVMGSNHIDNCQRT